MQVDPGACPVDALLLWCFSFFFWPAFVAALSSIKLVCKMAEQRMITEDVKQPGHYTILSFNLLLSAHDITDQTFIFQIII